MSKVRYTVRFYRQHDYDLLSFSMQYRVDLIQILYSSLKAYCKGESFTVKIPERQETLMPSLRRVYIKALILDDTKDKEAVDLLTRIKEGYRNNFFRTLLRIYICYPIPPAFLYNESEINLFQEKANTAFRNGKKESTVGQSKKKLWQSRATQNKEESNSAASSAKQTESNSTDESKILFPDERDKLSPGESNELMDVFASLMNG